MIKRNGENTRVVWFNHWFGTSYFLMEEAKRLGNFVISTSKHSNMPYIDLADIWKLDNDISNGDEYVDWALNFCIEHKVDVFFPKFHSSSISKRKHEFEAIGVKVIVEDYETMVVFDSKINTYNISKNMGLGEYMPEYFKVTSEKEYQEVRDYFIAKTGRFAMKYDNDEGGISYRCVEASISYTNYINRKSSSRNISVNAANELIHSVEMDSRGFKDIIIMEKLGSKEASVDCYNSSKGLIVIPRFKLASKAEEIRYDEEIINICKTYQDKFNFKAPWNIQLMQRDRADIPDDKGMKILEINPRFSGGSFLSSMSGISTVDAVMHDISGIEYKPGEFKSCKFVKLLYPIKLK